MHWFNSEIIWVVAWQQFPSCIKLFTRIRAAIAFWYLTYQLPTFQARSVTTSLIWVPLKTTKHTNTNKNWNQQNIQQQTKTAAQWLVLGTIGGCQWVKSTLSLQYVTLCCAAEMITAAHKHHWKSKTLETILKKTRSCSLFTTFWGALSAAKLLLLCIMFLFCSFLVELYTRI